MAKKFNGFSSIRRFSDEFHVRLTLKHRRNSFAKHRMVIDSKHLDSFRHSVYLRAWIVVSISDNLAGLNIYFSRITKEL